MRISKRNEESINVPSSACNLNIEKLAKLIEEKERQFSRIDRIVSAFLELIYNLLSIDERKNFESLEIAIDGK